MGVYCIQPSLALIASCIRCQAGVIIYLHIRGAFDVVLALYQRCTLKDDISYLLPT